MHLSIIIINFNTVTVTTNCLSSLLVNLSGDLKYEVILVDNAPKSDNEGMFKKLIPDLIYIRSETNIGFGRANNLGMEVASGDYYLLLNSDTIIFDTSIQRCFAFIRKEENLKVGLVGCKLLNEDGTYQASFYPFVRNNLVNYFISNNPILQRIFSVSKAYKESMEARKVGDISGAFMLLRKEVYESVGGFDPDFFLYCEETEWCRNRISNNFDIIYYPVAAVIHLGGKSAPTGLMLVQAQLSLALYWYKTGILNYILYIIYSYLNTIFFLFQYPLSNDVGRLNIRRYIGGLYKIQKYLYLDIPRYNRKFSSRIEPLIFEDAKGVFFP